jgi:hypothetical protein
MLKLERFSVVLKDSERPTIEFMSKGTLLVRFYVDQLERKGKFVYGLYLTEGFIATREDMAKVLEFIHDFKHTVASLSL